MKTSIYTILIVALSCVCLTLGGVPAKRGPVWFTQPDGSRVSVRIIGDEFGHVMTDSDGHALVTDGQGFLTYASFQSDGKRTSSGVRYGSKGSEDVKNASRNIPWAAIRSHSGIKRKLMRAQCLETAASLRGRIATKASPASAKAIVILAEFSDLKFKFDKSYFEHMTNQTGYSYNGATGSVTDYFNDQIGDVLQVIFDVGPVVTLSRGYKYYGENNEKGEDKRAAQAAAEACRLADSAVNFAEYECVYIIYAGGSPADGSEDDDHIWPHSWDLESAGIRLFLDGKQITSYSMSPELQSKDNSSEKKLTGIGCFCHEFSHILGLPDFYDSDYEDSGGEANALWFSTSIMDGGSYNNNGNTPPGYNSIELEMLGLMEPEPIEAGAYTLEPLTKKRRAIRADSSNEGEYYLFECRALSGWDKYIGLGSGMLIYHVDKSLNPAGYSTTYEFDMTAWDRWDYREVNCNPNHECADLVEASPAATSTSQIFFPYSTHKSFSAITKPAFVYWSGEESVYSLNNIAKVDGNVTFTVSGPISLDLQDAYQDAVILNWHTDVEACKGLVSKIKWTDDEGIEHITDVAAYDNGKYAYTIEGLKPGRRYTASIYYLIDGEEAFPVRVEFNTPAINGLPFIFIKGAPRRVAASTDNSNKLPLRVHNAVNPKSIAWYFNGKEIHTSEDGYYHITTSGTLKACISYGNGTEEIIIKEIWK